MREEHLLPIIWCNYTIHSCQVSTCTFFYWTDQSIKQSFWHEEFFVNFNLNVFLLLLSMKYSKQIHFCFQRFARIEIYIEPTPFEDYWTIFYTIQAQKCLLHSCSEICWRSRCDICNKPYVLSPTFWSYLAQFIARNPTFSKCVDYLSFFEWSICQKFAGSSGWQINHSRNHSQHTSQLRMWKGSTAIVRSKMWPCF